MLHDRYEVKATRGRKILHREYFEDLYEAEEMLETLEYEFPDAEIEFRDHKPFDAR